MIREWQSLSFSVSFPAAGIDGNQLILYAAGKPEEFTNHPQKRTNCETIGQNSAS
jgi:hypothetical protein